MVPYAPLKHSTVRRTAFYFVGCRHCPPKLRIVDTMKQYLSMKNLLSRRAPNPDRAEAGFTLMETLVALVILTFGLLAAGQMMYLAMGSNSLSRSKGSAITVAQDRLEFLADRYRQSQGDPDLTVGTHTFLVATGETAPVPVEVKNPNDNTTLNRFTVTWTVSQVSDPRAGRVLAARQVLVTVTPAQTTGTTSNTKAGLNKVVNVTAIFSPKLT